MEEEHYAVGEKMKCHDCTHFVDHLVNNEAGVPKGVEPWCDAQGMRVEGTTERCYHYFSPDGKFIRKGNKMIFRRNSPSKKKTIGWEWTERHVVKLGG